MRDLHEARGCPDRCAPPFCARASPPRARPPPENHFQGQGAAKATIDLNKATADELQELRGVGEVTAKKIIAGRPYSKVDDLAKAGVPARVIESIRSKVHVG